MSGRPRGGRNRACGRRNAGSGVCVVKFEDAFATILSKHDVTITDRVQRPGADGFALTHGTHFSIYAGHDAHERGTGHQAEQLKFLEIVTDDIAVA